jgi:formate dehydrogenase subunit delta
MSHDEHKDKLNKKLIRMGNQIATFFSSQDQTTASKDVAEHINKFWEPRMRRDLFDISDKSTNGFHDLLVAALPSINKPRTE